MSNEQLPNGQNNTHVSKQRSDGEYHVVLPCEVKEFRQFIGGLLGKPQEARGEIEGVFQISHKEISNICHLITQRVGSQNEASLVHLGITVYYDNGNAITHNNVADFESYYPTTPCLPAGISIDFTYLIKFQNKAIPEKQEINVLIETDAELAQQRVRRWFRTGLFSYRILHTERTWASDIANLLKSHAEGIVQKPGIIAKFLTVYEDEVTEYLSLSVLAVVLGFWCKKSLLMLQNPQAFFGGNYTDTSINQYWVISVTVISVLAIVLYAIRHLFQYHITLRANSMIVLTDKDAERKHKYDRSYVKRWALYIGGWTMSIVSGIVSSYLYSNAF